jgi:hypothetical protein
MSTSLPILSDLKAQHSSQKSEVALCLQPVERCLADDRFHDYILGEYLPSGVFENHLRSVNLLFESFALAGVEEKGRALVAHLREQLGAFRTVWGIKFAPSKPTILGWELYFYDFERIHPDLNLPHLIEIFAPFLAIEATEPFPLPWHMVSVSFGIQELQKAHAPLPLNVYVDARSYELIGKRLELRNLYTFHHPRTEIDQVIHRLKCSLHLQAQDRESLVQLLPPELLRCDRVCVANKRWADALYFSQISTTAVRRFLQTHRWPEHFLRYFDHYSREMQHLRWDVGRDFRWTPDGLVTEKTGFYGSF